MLKNSLYRQFGASVGIWEKSRNLGPPASEKSAGTMCPPPPFGLSHWLLDDIATSILLVLFKFVSSDEILIFYISPLTSSDTTVTLELSLTAESDRVIGPSTFWIKFTLKKRILTLNIHLVEGKNREIANGAVYP